MKLMKIAVLCNSATTPASTIERKVNEWITKKQDDLNKEGRWIKITDIKVAGTKHKIFIFILYNH